MYSFPNVHPYANSKFSTSYNLNLTTRDDHIFRFFDEILKIADDREIDNLSAEIAEIKTALGQSLFYVAVLGNFKRGKSTLINALMGCKTVLEIVTGTTSTKKQRTYHLSIAQLKKGMIQ